MCRKVEQLWHKIRGEITVFKTISFTINKVKMKCLNGPQFIMGSDLIILNSLIIVIFSLFMVLDSTSLKLSADWNICICKEWFIGQ